MNRRFGTDGIRGVANRELTPELAMQLGRAIAVTLDGPPELPILVGRDTRISGDMLECALVAGIVSAGRNALAVGIAPTPAIALLTKNLDVLAGVMISASHNPIEDNGFKVFDSQGMKLPDSVEDVIELAIDQDPSTRPTHTGVGRLEHVPEYLEMYVDALTDGGERLDGLTVIIDAAYGAAWECAPRALAKLGATVVPMHAEPLGEKINVACGATDLRALEDAVRASAEHGVQAIGIAFDGDADRVRFVDETGCAVDGDAIFLAIARDLHSRGELGGATVVGTVMSNLACEQDLAKTGITLLRTPVGDRYVLERLRKEGAIFGGEPSGHIIDLRRNATGDGPATAIALLQMLHRTGRGLRDLAAQYTAFPQELINIRVSRSTGILDHPDLQAATNAASALLGSDGRLLIRASGTEPLIRVMVEGKDAALVHRIAADLAGTVTTLAEAVAA